MKTLCGFFGTGGLLLIALWINGMALAADSLPEIVEVTPEEVTAPHVILGLPKHQWLTYTGPVIWSLLLIAIATRHLRIKGRTRQLLRIHKTCGYTAFLLATFHGALGLFF